MAGPISFNPTPSNPLPKEPDPSSQDIPSPVSKPMEQAPPLNPARIQQQLPKDSSLSQTAEKISSTILKPSLNPSSEDYSTYSLDQSTVLENLKTEIPDLDTSSLDDKKLLILGLLLHTLHMESKAYSKSPEELADMYSRDRDVIKKIDLDRVSCSLSTKEVMEIFNKYGVIQLRPLIGDSLLLGCGHGHHHHHSKDVDTINMMIPDNPTICAEWGNRHYLRFFQDNCRYNQILDEGPILALSMTSSGSAERTSELNNFFDFVRASLKPGGLLALPKWPFIRDKTKLSLDMIPKDFKKEDSPPEQTQESHMESFWFKYVP